MPFPKPQAAVNALLQIWFEKIANWSALYNLSAEIVKQIRTDAVVYNHLILASSQLEADKDEFYAYKKQLTDGNPKGSAADYPSLALLPLPALEGDPKPGITARNTELYNYLKSHPNRTPESLADLGIGGAASHSVSPDELKPSLKIKAMPDDKVEIAFNKQNQKACRIQMRRGGTDWATDGDPSTSPYLDETASTGGNPEKREYRAIYLKENKPFGQYSDIVTVVTTP